MSSSHDGAEQAVAAALERARVAVAALVEPPSEFLDGMRLALQQAEAALQQQPRGNWPGSLPKESKYLTRLDAESPTRPAREAAYAAMAKLKEVGFAAASSTDRSRKSIMNKRQKTAAAAATPGDADERGASEKSNIAWRACHIASPAHHAFLLPILCRSLHSTCRLPTRGGTRHRARHDDFDGRGRDARAGRCHASAA